MRLNDLPEGRYFDGTYEWDWDGDEWYPLRAPSGMPSTPRLEELSRVVTYRVPLDADAPAVERSNRCRFTWDSARGRVQCWHDAGHGGRHQAWSSRKDRRRHPDSSSWVAVGAESVCNGRWLDG